MAVRHRGPYFDVPLSCWPHIIEEFQKPWLEETAIADLMYWSSMADNKKDKRPTKAGLAKRWGWDEEAVRGVLTSIAYPKHRANENAVIDDHHLAVFDVWEGLNKQRTGRENTFTASRKRIVKAACKEYPHEDLILVVRMAFEYPYEDFIVKHWRNQDFMDLMNLLNRDKVDRNVGRAKERWDGSKWVPPKAKVTSKEGSTGEKAWRFVLNMVRSKPARPDRLHKDPRSNAAMNIALDAVGGWSAIEDVRAGYEMNKLAETFQEVVMSSYHSWEPPMVPYLAVVDGEKK